jgi:hypothetical protein
MTDIEAELAETRARLHDNQLIADAAYDRADRAEAENKRLREALQLTSGRLQAFVRAVGDITDCSADVAALDIADAALRNR